jgi:hypothetical protein
MYFVLYDRFLKSIGETYILESWNRTQRATDFDELKIVGAEIPQSANPFLVVINDRQGKQMFSGLASTPAIDDKTKKTSLSLKDYLTLFNSEIIVDWDDWNSFTDTTLAGFINFVFNTWKNQIDVGLENIVCDTSAINDIELDTELYTFKGKENVLAYNLISDVINYYGLYNEAKLDLKNKTLTFYFKKASLNPLEIRLSDFGITAIEKSFGDYNRASVYSYDFVKNQEWALTENNNIVKLPTSESLVYPAKNRNFIAEEPKDDLTETQAINDAVYEAVMGLAGNRYQENIDLNAQQYKSIIDLTNIDFSYKIKVYTNEGEYKTLPVGEIETDNKGKHIVRLGHRIQELTQEL